MNFWAYGTWPLNSQCCLCAIQRQKRRNVHLFFSHIPFFFFFYSSSYFKNKQARASAPSVICLLEKNMTHGGKVGCQVAEGTGESMTLSIRILSPVAIVCRRCLKLSQIQGIWSVCHWCKVLGHKETEWKKLKLIIFDKALLVLFVFWASRSLFLLFIRALQLEP